MKLTRRSIGFMLLGAGVCLLVVPFDLVLGRRALARAQDPPNRREFTITAKNYTFSPDRIEVTQDDLVKITLRSADEAHSFVIDGYRIMKRVPAGGSTTFEFRADKTGTFAFYCGMTSAEGHGRMKGELVVAAR
jgi:heme/copper-type cytochrome/quinol oxidase subunit 2